MAELSLYGKLINSVYKLVTDRQAELPLYYGNDIPEYVPPADTQDMEHISFRAANVSKRGTKKLVAQLAGDWRVNLAGFGMMIDGRVVYEYYPDYNRPACRHVSFSMCKSVVSMAVGIAVEQGLLTLDERLCDIFPEHNGVFLKRSMREVTLKSLLTMTAGVTFDEMSSYFDMDWRKAFMGSELGFEPGTDFGYNSLNTYMLAAAISKKSGRKFIDFINENLFVPMNIRDITWDKCPQGIEQGGWGMKLSIPDMLKFGELYLNRGAWSVDGVKRQLVPAEWVEESLKCHVQLDEKRVVKGYGYHIWLLKDGAFLFNGVFGQNVYVNPGRRLVIAVTASAYELFPDGNLVERLCCFAANDENFKRDLYFKRDLSLGIHAVSFNRIDIHRQRDMLRELVPYMAGRTYYFDDYTSDIVPFSTQVMYSNFMTGIRKLRFYVKSGIPVLQVVDDDKPYTIPLGFGRIYRQQTLTVNGKEYRISTHCSVSRDADRRILLKIRILFPEEISDKQFILFFDGDEVECSASETPDIFKFAKLLIGEKKMLRTRKLEHIKFPDYMDYKLQKLIAPIAVGHAVEE